MSNSRDVLVTVASWEERFVAGFVRILDRVSVKSAIVLYSDRYADWTVEARQSVEQECRTRSIALTWGVLYDGEPARTWSDTLASVFAGVAEGASACVDITTMPRETIWQSLWFLEYRRCEVGYVYHRPDAYGEWLSRDPGRPRLVYKMSGIARLGTRTALLITAGYDIDRVKHLTEVFEPGITLLGLQQNSIDEQNESKMKAVEAAFVGDSSVEVFWIDAFGPDRGKSAIANALGKVVDSHNVVMASMGPKLSAVSLYELHRSRDSLGLIYLPSSEFNRRYSRGIGESIWGDVIRE